MTTAVESRPMKDKRKNYLLSVNGQIELILRRAVAERKHSNKGRDTL